MFTTQNTANITEQIVYSAGLQQSMQQNILGFGLFNDVTSDFPTGITYTVDQVGDVLLQAYSENSDIQFSSVDTGRITLEVTDYDQAAFYITDQTRQDSGKADRFFAINVASAMRKFEEKMESDIFAQQKQQTPGDENKINRQPHRFVLAANASASDIEDLFADMKLSLDKANMPDMNRLAIVDGTVENVLNKGDKVKVAENPQYQGIINTGFVQNHRFVRNIYGFDIYTSNLLAEVSGETVGGTAISGSQIGVANLAMYVGDSEFLPFMGVIRQPPTPEFERNVKKKRDEWSATSRWGFALQRPESLIVFITQFQSAS